MSDTRAHGLPAISSLAVLVSLILMPLASVDAQVIGPEESLGSFLVDYWGENPTQMSPLAPSLPALPVLGGQPSPVNDPFLDAFDIFGEGPPLHDFGAVNVSYSADMLNVSVAFFTSIAPPSSGSPDTVIAAFEIDVDQNPATGVPAIQNCFSPPLASLTLGVDFIVDLVNEANHPGEIDVIDVMFGSIVATVPVSYEDDVISFSIPLDSIGDEGDIDFTFICGTPPQPTDAQNVIGVSVSEGDPFFRGDCNGDGVLGFLDAIYLLNVIGGVEDAPSCFDACDANDDGSQNLADALLTLGFLFIGGPPPAAPYPDCNFDGTEDELSCVTYPFCSR